MHTISNYLLTTTWLPQSIQEPVDTLVLAFPWREAGDDGSPEWEQARLGLGWTRDGLVFTGAMNTPLLFAMEDDAVTDEGRTSRQDAFDAISEHGSLLVCAMDDSDRPIAVARFQVSPQDPTQTHFQSVRPDQL